MDDIDHVCCPRNKCRRKLIPINFSAHPQLTGQLFCYCPNCLRVWFSESVYDEEPKLILANFTRKVPLSVEDTYETYQTMSLCMLHYMDFLLAAWREKRLTNSARHTIFTHIKHLEKVSKIVLSRMNNLDKHLPEK